MENNLREVNDDLMKEWFPKYMKEKFNLDYQYFDNQIEFSIMKYK